MSIATWETVLVIVIPNLDFNLGFFDNITTGLQSWDWCLISFRAKIIRQLNIFLACC